MKSYWRATAAIVALTAALTLGALLPATPGHSQSTGPKVIVANGPTQPVPVTLQGTCAIAGNVNVANTPNVNVTSLPAVQLAAGNRVGIDAAANTVRDADQPAWHRFQAENSLQASGFNNANPFGLVAVPAGKRAVIETVSAVLRTPPGVHGMASLGAVFGGARSRSKCSRSTDLCLASLAGGNCEAPAGKLLACLVEFRCGRSII